MLKCSGAIIFIYAIQGARQIISHNMENDTSAGQSWWTGIAGKDKWNSQSEHLKQRVTDRKSSVLPLLHWIHSFVQICQNTVRKIVSPLNGTRFELLSSKLFQPIRTRVILAIYIGTVSFKKKSRLQKLPPQDDLDTIHQRTNGAPYGCLSSYVDENSKRSP